MLNRLRPLRVAVTLQLTVSALAVPGLAAQEREIILATTTSTDDTGLLDSLLPMFREAGPP